MISSIISQNYSIIFYAIDTRIKNMTVNTRQSMRKQNSRRHTRPHVLTSSKPSSLFSRPSVRPDRPSNTGLGLGVGLGLGAKPSTSSILVRFQLFFREPSLNFFLFLFIFSQGGWGEEGAKIPFMEYIKAPLFFTRGY